MPNQPKQDKNAPAEEQQRYGREWAERDRQRREDRERQRDEPDYGGPFGL